MRKRVIFILSVQSLLQNKRRKKTSRRTLRRIQQRKKNVQANLGSLIFPKVEEDSESIDDEEDDDIDTKPSKVEPVEPYSATTKKTWLAEPVEPYGEEKGETGDTPAPNVQPKKKPKVCRRCRRDS